MPLACATFYHTPADGHHMDHQIVSVVVVNATVASNFGKVHTPGKKLLVWAIRTRRHVGAAPSAVGTGIPGHSHQLTECARFYRMHAQIGLIVRVTQVMKHWRVPGQGEGA
jgi:hypothetical protein